VARSSTGFISHTAPSRFFRQELRTSATIRSELVASLDLYSEVKVIGRKLLADRGHTNLKVVYPQLQSYMRQANRSSERRSCSITHQFATTNPDTGPTRKQTVCAAAFRSTRCKPG
jgi:hypothetical protein